MCPRMTACPKCETRLREGSRKCPICGTPLKLRGFALSERERAEPLVDPLLDLFEHDERVIYCPQCWNEFRLGQHFCRPCGVRLEADFRSRYERGLLRRPVFELGTTVAKGPPAVPPGLIQVKIAADIDEARAFLEELRFVGLEAWPGSDLLDLGLPPSKVGIYVDADDREAAAYVLEGYRPADPLDRPPSQDLPASNREMARAQGYLEIGKYRDAIRLFEEIGSGEALALASEAVLRAGRIREAERRALAAADKVENATVRAILLARAALVRALGHDGTPFGKGSNLEGARTLLEEAVRLSPRVLEVGKILAEVLAAGNDRPALRAELTRLARLNPNLLARDGHFRALRDALGII